MPRKPTGKPTGEHKAVIDWKIVDLRLEAGNTGMQIAASLGIHEDTLYIRCAKEKGMAFSAYAQSKKALGDSNIAYKQYIKAIGPDKHSAFHGSEKMLIHLGMDRLGQMKKESVQHSGEVKQTVFVIQYAPPTEDIEKIINVDEKYKPKK